MNEHTMSVMEAAKILGLGRVVAYRLAANGGIPAIRLGRKLRVPTGALMRFLECDRAGDNEVTK